MTIVTNVGRSLLDPEQQPRGNAQLTYTLTNRDGDRVERFMLDGSGPVYIGDATAELDTNGEHSIDLQANEGLEDSHYVVKLKDGRSRRQWLIQVPDSATPVDFWELVAAGRPISDGEYDSLYLHVHDDDRHLSETERAALSGANNPSASNPLRTLEDVDSGPPGDDGPPGPSSVSTDAGNLATLGTDSLITVQSAAVAAAAPVQDNDARLTDARQPVSGALIRGYEVQIDNRSGIGLLTLIMDGMPRDIVLTGDLSLAFTPPASGHAGALVVWMRQNATGGHTLTLPADVLWPGCETSGIDTAPNALTLLTAISNPLTGLVQVAMAPYGVAP